MSERALRLHRSYGNQDMHERLRRLLYEAFFGVESAGTSVGKRQHDRPKLLLFSPAWRSGMSDSGEGKARHANGGGNAGAEPKSVGGESDDAPASDAPGVVASAWEKPLLNKLG